MKIKSAVLGIIPTLVLLAVAAGIVFSLRPVWVFRQIQGVQLHLSGVESEDVLLGGHRIHYFVRGPIEGKPIVMIHGLGGRAEDWLDLAPYLQKAGYRIYTPDLLGYGESEQPASATYSIPEQADLVAQFLDAMHLQQTDLVGWSMGGWIVQRVAFEHPARITRLVLLDSAGLKMAPSWDTRLFTPDSPEQLDALNALLMPKPPTVPGFLARDIIQTSQQNAWVVQRALASMLTARDVTDAQLPTLKMPVLILWGDLDRITPVSEAHAIHALIPQSQLEVVPGCGHLAPEQCADRFSPPLLRFLQTPAR